ncbi:MAG: hypothetical protein J6S67_23540 [Methanobrevibacter sp.]|nr:hypothetical protein [Methanobrevibacter sp.]
MAYEKHTWTTGDVITVARLNHIEDGIEEAGTTGGGGKLQLVYIQGTGGNIEQSMNNGDDTRGETKGDTKSEKVRAIKSSGVKTPFEPLENDALYRADGTLFCEINPYYETYEEAYADSVRIKAELDEAGSIWIMPSDGIGNTLVMFYGYDSLNEGVECIFYMEANFSLTLIDYYNDANDMV